MFNKKKKRILRLENLLEEEKRTSAGRFRLVKVLNKLVNEYEDRWKSPGGEQVLKDLELALNCIQQYQKTLIHMGCLDPVLLDANGLLKRYKMQSYSKSSVVGLDDRIKAEMEKWGSESFSKSLVEISAERTDEGDKIHIREVE